MRKSLYLALTRCAASFGVSQLTGNSPQRPSARLCLPLAAELADPAAQLRLLLSLPSSVCLQVRFSRSEALPLSALATGLRFAAGAATTTRRAHRFLLLDNCPLRSSLILHSC
jgi:hypothetical protein